MSDPKNTGAQTGIHTYPPHTAIHTATLHPCSVFCCDMVPVAAAMVCALVGSLYIRLLVKAVGLLMCEDDTERMIFEVGRRGGSMYMSISLCVCE